VDNGFIAHIEFNVQRGVSQAISVLAVATIAVKYTVFALRASDRQADGRTDGLQYCVLSLSSGKHFGKFSDPNFGQLRKAVYIT